MLMTLDAPEGRSAEDLCNSAVIAAAECRSQHADILGLLLNRVSLPGLPWPDLCWTVVDPSGGSIFEVTHLHPLKLHLDNELLPQATAS